MNPTTQSNDQKKSMNNNAFDQKDAKIQLKKIGDEIEAIAHEWKAQGKKGDFEGLYELGNRVEHFLDNSQDDVANQGTCDSDKQETDRLS